MKEKEERERKVMKRRKRIYNRVLLYIIIYIFITVIRVEDETDDKSGWNWNQ